MQRYKKSGCQLPSKILYMKNWMIVLWASLTMASCAKTVHNGWIRGEVVHRSCATIAVQVKDSAYLHLGQDSWQQASDKPVYRYVFAVENPCDFPANAKAGSSILFKIIQQDTNDCAICMLWDNPPAKKQLVKATIEGD